MQLMADYVIDTTDVLAGMGPAVRCVNCGLYLDAVMIRNRGEGYCYASTEIRRTTPVHQNAA